MGIKSNFEKCKPKQEQSCNDPAFPVGGGDTPDGYTNVYINNEYIENIQEGDTLIWNSETNEWVIGDGSSNKFTIKHVTTPYTLAPEDSNNWLVFNTSQHAVVFIPDGFEEGIMFMCSNIGGGNLSAEPEGTNTVRGAKSITDVTSMMSFTKVTETVWQSSERLPGGPEYVAT